MSNDLISRSALMQSLRSNLLVDVTPNLEQAIDEQPTACNVDKMIKRLEELIICEESRAAQYDEAGKYDLMCICDEKVTMCKELIKIVKSGGIE